MAQGIVARVREFINKGKSDNVLVLHKRINGKDWYIGERFYDYLMVTSLDNVVTLNLKGKTDGLSKDEWLRYANSNFANGWSLMKLDKNRQTLQN